MPNGAQAHAEAALRTRNQLCTTHRLVLRETEERTLVKFSTFATTLIVNRLRTHSYRVTGP
jgi:hypothetical protein